jgi:hypothetical protein
MSLAADTVQRLHAHFAPSPPNLQVRGDDGASPDHGAGGGIVLFDVAKREAYTPAAGYKKLVRRLRATHDVKTCVHRRLPRGSCGVVRLRGECEATRYRTVHPCFCQRTRDGRTTRRRGARRRTMAATAVVKSDIDGRS